MNLIERAWIWLTTKHQKEMPVPDTAEVQPVVTTQEVAEQPTPASEVSAGVKDFSAALSFIEDGLKHLGEASKDELVLLAKKYL